MSTPSLACAHHSRHFVNNYSPCGIFLHTRQGLIKGLCGHGGQTCHIRLVCEMGRIALQYGPFCTAKWAVLGCEMGHFRAQNGPFCNTLCTNALHNALFIMQHHRTQQSAPRASSTSENFCSATCELRMRHSAG